MNNPIILVSSLSETGHAEAKKSIPEADYHVYMPFDFYFLIAPIVNRVSPDLVILCETDFWYHFLRASKKCGAVIALVNGKISLHSLKAFQYLKAFSKRLFSFIDLYCLQSQHYQERFVTLDVPPENMIITGNLKFDDEPRRLNEEEKSCLRDRWGIAEHDPVIVIGSSHDPEERQLMQIIQKFWQFHPSLKVVIIPRHPERFATVADLLSSMKISFHRHSKGKNSQPSNSNVILVDEMGLLRNAYQIADIAIVAGSYTEKVGGHNVLEPLWFGVPTIFGPHMHSQPELFELVTATSSSLMVPLEKLESTIAMLLQDSMKVASLRENGFKLVSSMRGSTDRTLDAIGRVMQRH